MKILNNPQDESEFYLFHLINYLKDRCYVNLKVLNFLIFNTVLTEEIVHKGSIL